MRCWVPLSLLASVMAASCAGPEPVAAEEPLAPKVEQKPAEDPQFVKERVTQLKDLERAKITIGGKTIEVWVADDYPKRQEGMMWLEERHVKPDEGMIFIFAKPAELSFWMRNTLLPLDLAFISSGRKILNVEQGVPLREAGIPAKGPAQYVLEMRAGAFKRLGIKPGMKVEMPASLLAKD